jgi:hypothetical protein
MAVDVIAENVPLRHIMKAVASTNAVSSKRAVKPAVVAMNFHVQNSSNSVSILCGYIICQS